MSNHSGGHMLNAVLLKLEEFGVFESLGKEKSFEIVNKIVSIGSSHDCNNDEILEDIGDRIGLCYCCMEKGEDLKDGMCKKCRKEQGYRS